MINLTLLASRFELEIKTRLPFLTEDSVRYIFFKCMLNQDNNTNHYVLELPYSMMDGKQTPLFVPSGSIQTSSSVFNQELDLFYDDGNQCICVEFKFHRNPLNNPRYAYTNAAGSIFNDINRLGLISCNRELFHRIVVYVTDDEMHKYLSFSSGSRINTVYRNGLKTVYNAPIGTILSEPKSAPQIFRDSSKKSLTSKNVRVAFVKRYNADFINASCCSFKKPGGCHIRVYEL